jgi:DNA-directed RNA polymerase specialized sigma24 family protein
MGITQDTPSREPEPPPDFEHLYEQFRLPVYRVVRGIVLDATLAERLTQETFERAYGQRGRLRRESPQVWIYRIAVEVAVRHLRGRWWNRLRLGSLGSSSLGSSGGRTRGPAGRSAAEDVLFSLSPYLRALVVLAFYARLSNVEIAGALQLPESVVSVQLEFATEVMRAALTATDQGGGRERL